MAKTKSLDRVEDLVLSNLVTNEDYSRKALPFLSDEYFKSRPDLHVYKLIRTYFDKYNKCPDLTTLKIEADSLNIGQEEANQVNETIDRLTIKSDDLSWLMSTTEKFCKDKAVYNAIMKSIQILDGKDQSFTKEALPSILQEALSIAFDKSVGHDYFEDAEARFDFYHQKDSKIPFHLEMFDKITKGGMSRKTLNCILAATGVGKSLFLCDNAAKQLASGRNVLYITCEMAEERISERIDCNLMDVAIDDLFRLKKKDFVNNVEDMKLKSYGKLVVKEYAPGSAHAGHFRALLDELKLKKDFTPDIIYIDYLNICASQRLKNNGSVNSYTYVKYIAEELRAIAVDYDLPVFTATQTNRGGANNSDISITDTSESFGLPMTLDFLFAGIRTEELDELCQIMFVQLKSRYGDINYYRKFVCGVDISKFKLYDAENVAQRDLADSGRQDIDSGPVFDKTKSGGYDFNFE